MICTECPFRLGANDPDWRYDFAPYIREAKPADEAKVREYLDNLQDDVMRKRFHGGNPDVFRKSRVEDFRRNPPGTERHLELMLILPCGRIGGVCHAYAGPDGFEVAISVWKELDGHGAGYSLMRALIALAHERTFVRTLYLIAEPTNTSMLSLARACGFHLSRLDCGEQHWELHVQQAA